MKNKIPYNTLIFHCVLSRLLYVLISSLSHYFIPHYDNSTGLGQANTIIPALYKWDACHYNDIAINGYIQEHTLAFFPLLPLMTRSIHHVIDSLTQTSIFGYKLIFMDLFTTGVLLNNFIFLVNSLLLFKLTLCLFNCQMAKASYYLFIFSPALIVFSSFYTESLFMLLFLISLFCIVSHRPARATIILSLSTLCRSNAVIFVFLFHKSRFFVLYLIFICIPIGLFQLYCLDKVLYSSLKFIIPYSYIQKKYWDQGFLRYFRWYRLEHILMNLPFILFSLYTIISNSKLRNKLKTESGGKSNLHFIFVALEIFMFVQTLMLIFFFYWSTFFRFISYNPII